MKVLVHRGYHGRAGPARRRSGMVPRLVAQRQIDVVIGNGENVAGGFGITPELAEELFRHRLVGDHDRQSCLG